MGRAADTTTVFSEWEEITLKKSNFDRLFRSGGGEDWNGTSAAKLRRENAHAWRGTRTGEDVNATVPMAEIRRQDELTAMDQWLLLQQKDGSLYLVMGYRSGTYRYRWVVRLNGGVTTLTTADLNGDGQVLYRRFHTGAIPAAGEHCGR